MQRLAPNAYKYTCMSAFLARAFIYCISFLIHILIVSIHVCMCVYMHLPNLLFFHCSLLHVHIISRLMCLLDDTYEYVTYMYVYVVNETGKEYVFAYVCIYINMQKYANMYIYIYIHAQTSRPYRRYGS
jgi:hypothetical protein